MPSQPGAWESWNVFWTQSQTCLLLNAFLYFYLQGGQLLKALLGSLLTFWWLCGQQGKVWCLLQPHWVVKPMAPK